MAPRVDVVILTWNDGPLLERAVASALASDGVEVRVIVVDNGSQPPAVVPDDPGVVLLRNEVNRGVAPARNQGIRHSDASFICLLDSDARLHADALAQLTTRLVRDETVALTVPVFSGQPATASAGAAPTLLRKAARGLNLTDTYRALARTGGEAWDVDFGIGACQVFRREAFDAVGGLDESIFYGPEDVDFCLRLKRRGWRVVQVGGARVDHPPRRRNRRLFTKRGLKHALAVLRHLRKHHALTRR